MEPSSEAGSAAGHTAPDPAAGRTAGRTAAGLVSLLIIAAVTVLSIVSVLPPKPAPADAPATDFSATRAYTHVATIGSHVHVAGSQAAADVRDYISSTLESYGLSTQVQDAIGADDSLGGTFAMAHVHNVVATLPGTDSTGTVFLMAHYDSVQVSYGGNDDGAGVASLLETARALAQGPRPRNTLVFVFTEAEEACLCGGEAFESQNPLAAKGGVVLNFEARGANGPVIMFETTRNNAGVVGVYGDSVPYPVATSFAVEVYRILPNDTDFTPFRDAGRFTGLNSAYIDGSAVYHSPEDKPSYMDQGTLQAHGANALALARAFGAADIATLQQQSAGDSTYFPAFGYLVRYPGWLVWPLAALALIAVAALALVARRRRLTTGRRIAAGVGLGLIPVLAGPVLAQALWALLVALRPGYREMIDPWQPDWFRACVVALVAVAVFTWYGLLRKRFGGWTLTIGALAWLAILGLVLAAAAPGGSYLAALPALAVAIAGVGALLLRPAVAGWAALTVAGAVAALILAPTVLLFFPALGLATGGAAALFATMLLLALLPVLEALYPVVGAARARLRGALPGLVSGVLALAFFATGLAVDHFDAAHPAPEQLMYALDADTGKALWVSDDTVPGPWNSGYVSTQADVHDAFPILPDGAWTGPAQAATLPAPTVSVIADTTSGGHRMVTLTLAPQRAVRLIYLRVSDVPVLAATVQGRQVPTANLAGQFQVLFHAPPADGITITMTLASTTPATLRVFDGSDGLDDLPGFTPRPVGIGVKGSHSSELVLVAKTYVI